jgi:hypothetical protein
MVPTIALNSCLACSWRGTGQSRRDYCLTKLITSLSYQARSAYVGCSFASTIRLKDCGRHASLPKRLRRDSFLSNRNESPQVGRERQA